MSAAIEQILEEMVATNGISRISATGESVEICKRIPDFKRPLGNHFIVAPARTYRGMQRRPTQTRPMTPRQKIAVMLEKGGYTHRQIAVFMKIKNRQTVGTLLQRAHERQEAIRQAALELLGESA